MTDEPRQATSSRRLLTAAVVLSAVVGGAVGATAEWALGRTSTPTQSSGGQPVSAGGASGSVSQVGTAASAAVVTVMTQPGSIDAAVAGTLDTASGFVVSADGLVVTSTHAVTGATQLRVATADGHVYQAVTVATDSDHGITVLRLYGAHSLTPLSFAAQPPKPGDLAVLVANTASGPEVGAGTIRSAGSAASVGPSTVAGAVTADVSVTAGDDGAPLLDGSGNVVGVAVVASAGGAMIAAAAAPAQRLVATLTAGSAAAAAPRFGIATEVLDPRVAGLLGVPPGAFVLAVTSGAVPSSALSAGDVITAVNGTAVDATHPLDPATFGLSSGATATLTVVAHGATSTVSVTVR